MKIVKSHRASEILANLLVSFGTNRTWLIPRNICPVVLEVFNLVEVDYCLQDIDGQGIINLDYIDTAQKFIPLGVLIVEAYGKNVLTSHIVDRYSGECQDVVFIKDKCLSYPKLLPDDRSCQAILYSTGYSKYVDLKEGGYCYLQNGINYLETLVFRSDKALYEKYYQNSSLNIAWTDTSYLDKVQKLSKSVKKIKGVNNKKIRKALKHFNYVELSDIWRYTILANNPDEIKKFLKSNNLLFSEHYKCLLHAERDINCLACSQSEKIINIFNDFRLQI